MIRLLPILSAALLASCGSSPSPRPPRAQATPSTEPPPPPAAPDAGPPAPAAPERVYLLERVGNTGIVQVYADLFEQLTQEQQIMAYELYRASIAGDRITYDQRYAHNLAIKDLLEATIAFGTASAPIVEYTKLFWVNHGVHDMRTSRKFVPAGFTWEELRDAARRARAAGATSLGANDTEVDALLERLRRPIFDAAFEPMCTNKSPPRGQDILTASANTFYPGVRLRDLRRFRERYPLNSRVVRQDGRLTELVYRAGDDNTPEGLYAAELRGVILHLAAASQRAPQAQRTYWDHLIRYFRTGDPQAFRDYNIGWVQDDPAVDAILGFIESYTDARGAKGAWEGITFYRNEERTGMMRAVAQNARYFEERTPWEARFRRTEFRPLVAATVDILVETGDGGPVSAAGINLPNEQAIRQQHGSRNFFLHNVMESGDRAVGEVAIREFAASEAEAAESARCQGPFYDAIVALHEVTGHASGSVSPDLRGDPREHLQQYYSTLEEARADLVALWHLADPKILELGMLPDARCVAAGYRLFVAGFLTSLRRYPDQTTLEEDHDRARSMIVRYALDRGAVRAEQRDGHWYLSVPDPDSFRQTIGQLLAEIQRIKGTGDFNAIRTLVERFGAPIEDSWRDDAIARARQIGLPTSFAYVSPRLIAERDAAGRVTDVRVERPESFLSLMLEWSAQGRQSAQEGRGMVAIR